VNAGQVESADQPLAQKDGRDFVDHLALFDGHPGCERSAPSSRASPDTDTTVLIRWRERCG